MKRDTMRDEINKQREIKRIIKGEQGKELDKNLKMFLNLNNEEKILRNELAEKQSELRTKEKTLVRSKTAHAARVRELRKSERTKFVGAFSQAKNLIEKQMKVGMMIRQKKNEKLSN